MGRNWNPRRRGPLTEAARGGDFCPRCGSYIKWSRLGSGRWIATDPEPVLYRSGGNEWLIIGNKWDAEIRKDCRTWRPGDPTDSIKKGKRIHAFECK